MTTCQREGCENPAKIKFCCTSCRVAAWHEAHYRGMTAEEALAGLPQKEFRAAVRRAAERRWPGKRGRFRVRFGKPGMEPGGPGPHS